MGKKDDKDKKNKPPKWSLKRPVGPASGNPTIEIPDGGDLNALFDAWGMRILKTEQSRPRGRLGLLTKQGLEEYYLDPRFGIDGAVQAAAIMSRVAEPEQPVALLAKVLLSGGAPPQCERDRNTGMLLGFTIGVVARSLDGFEYGRLFNGQVSRRGLQTVAWDMDDDVRAQLSWDVDMFVDPGLEDMLAQQGFPGANLRKPAMASLFVAKAPTAAPAAPEPPRKPIVKSERIGPALRWESAQRGADELWDFSPNDVGRVPRLYTQGSPIPGLETRALEELFVCGWRNEAQAVMLTGRLVVDPDRVRCLRMLLTSAIPERTKRVACAIAADIATGHKDTALMQLAVTELFDRQSGVEGGDLRAWLARVWPEGELGIEDMLATCDIAAAAAARTWRAGLALREENSLGDFPSCLADLHALRDALLDRVGIVEGPADERVLAAAALLLRDEASPEMEVRLERLSDALNERMRRSQTPDLVLQDYACWHAVSLHTAGVAFQLLAARKDAVASDDRSLYGTAAIAAAPLVERGRELLARHSVHEATWAAAEEAVPEALALLRRARSLAPGSATIRSTYAEARFVAGEWDEELCSDLIREALDFRSDVACVAELLVVAESLGREKPARFARRELISRTAGTPHHWMAQVRALFARPLERGQLDRVNQLLGDKPTAESSWSDTRVGRALYGRSAQQTIDEAHRALTGQRDALEWAILVREVGLEDAQPEPAIEEDDVVERLAALGARLGAVWPLAAQAPAGRDLFARATALAERVAAANEGALDALEAELSSLLLDATERASGAAHAAPTPAQEDDAALGALEEDAEPDDGFLPMRASAEALERSRRELATPEWAIAEGLRQIAFYNLARGGRDAKMLRGTRDHRGGLWELRHRDARNPVRVLYRLGPDGPVVDAVLAKRDDAHQRRMIARVQGW